MEVRQVLTMNEGERLAVKREHPELAGRAALMFNGGRVCGQCAHFSQMGTQQGSLKNTGLNGNCRALAVREYLKPETVSCRSFVKRPGG